MLGLGFLVHQNCQGEERTRATIVLDVGDAAPRVRSIDAQLIVEGDVIGVFHRKALPGLQIGDARFEASMPAQDGELRVDVDVDGTRRRVVRSIHVEEGATVTVPLERDLGVSAP